MCRIIKYKSALFAAFANQNYDTKKLKSNFNCMASVWADGLFYLFMSVDCQFLMIHACAVRILNWLILDILFLLEYKHIQK